jgi:hypothetical protein
LRELLPLRNCNLFILAVRVVPNMKDDIELGNANSSDPDLRPSLTTCLQDGRVLVTGGWNESNQVGWDGDGDPANPMNWSGIKKTANVGIVSILAFIP